MTDYFAFFGLERKLALDPQLLEQRYYALSRKLHRDVRGSLDEMALLNDAYRVLKDPIQRAEYLLKQSGIAETKSVAPEILEEAFELNESGDAEQARARLEEIDRELTAAFSRWDETADTNILKQIRALLDRRKYIGKALCFR